MKNNIALIALFILLNSLPVTPAEADDDRQFWNTLVLHHALNRKFESHLAMHSRELNDFSTLGVYYAAPGFFYTLTDHLVFGLNYKFQRLKAKSVWTNEHRIEIQPIVKWAWDRLKFSLRNRLEYRNVEGIVEWRLRERFRFKHAVNWGSFKFAPFISDEFFYSFKTGGLSQNRIMVGASKTLYPAIWNGHLLYVQKQQSARRLVWGKCYRDGFFPEILIDFSMQLIFHLLEEA